MDTIAVGEGLAVKKIEHDIEDHIYFVGFELDDMHKRTIQYDKENKAYPVWLRIDTKGAAALRQFVAAAPLFYGSQFKKLISGGAVPFQFSADPFYGDRRPVEESRQVTEHRFTDDREHDEQHDAPHGHASDSEKVS